MRSPALATAVLALAGFLLLVPSNVPLIGSSEAKADVCCVGPHGRAAWYNSARQCYRAGGRVVGNRACRRDWHDGGGGSVCCMGPLGRSGWYNSARQCYHRGGRVVSARHCRRGSVWPGYGDTTTVCCKRGRRDWWTTWYRCRRAGGHVVANRYCRRD
jgi:hypothetical protein